MMNESDVEIKNIFLDVIHFCGDLQGAFNRVVDRYSTVVKFTYSENVPCGDRLYSNLLIATIRINEEPIIQEKMLIHDIMILDQARADLKHRLMSSIFILGVVSAKEKLDSVKNNKPNESN